MNLRGASQVKQSFFGTSRPHFEPGSGAAPEGQVHSAVHDVPAQQCCGRVLLVLVLLVVLPAVEHRKCSAMHRGLAVAVTRTRRPRNNSYCTNMVDQTRAELIALVFVEIRGLMSHVSCLSLHQNSQIHHQTTRALIRRPTRVRAPPPPTTSKK